MSSPFPPNIKIAFLKKVTNYGKESLTGNAKSTRTVLVEYTAYMAQTGEAVSIQEVSGLNWTSLPVKIFFVEPMRVSPDVFGLTSAKIEPLFPEKLNVPYGELYSIDWTQTPWDAVVDALGTKLTGQFRTEGGKNA